MTNPNNTVSQPTYYSPQAPASPAPAAPAAPVQYAHPQPAQVCTLRLFRNALTGNTVTLADGRQVAEWAKLDDGSFVQDSVEPANAQLNDTVVFTGMQALAFSDPALFFNKLELAESHLPSNLCIRPIAPAVMHPVINRRAHFSKAGSWVGFVAEKTASNGVVI